MKTFDHQKAMEAAGYLIEILDDALGYTPGQLLQQEHQLILEVSHLNTKFSIAIDFRKELQLNSTFKTGIVQTECKKIRDFVEDLECYLKVAHAW
ncbi:hypothetical protein [Pedobacter xixiisoli]|uniref:Uncharacterized protein n=1 Tax=Pedobacter xixiisoli TaxID=1476464 RepID=A0A285ZSF6_9SPHI|nr:hypothetical protein [Pedobacter xixiisoli]SOD12572.1 hypothetical protein SAMN06297358_0738 [Pedobacter xixiisoli]